MTIRFDSMWSTCARTHSHTHPPTHTHTHTHTHTATFPSVTPVIVIKSQELNKGSSMLSFPRLIRVQSSFAQLNFSSCSTRDDRCIWKHCSSSDVTPRRPMRFVAPTQSLRFSPALHAKVINFLPTFTLYPRHSKEASIPRALSLRPARSEATIPPKCALFHENLNCCENPDPGPTCRNASAPRLVQRSHNIYCFNIFQLSESPCPCTMMALQSGSIVFWIAPIVAVFILCLCLEMETAFLPT